MSEERKHLTEEALEEYLDGVTEAGALAAADRHLAECLSCRERAKELQTVAGALRAMPLNPVNPSFTARVLDQIERETGAASRVPAVAGWLAGILGLVFVGSALLALFTLLGVIPLRNAAGGGWEAATRYLADSWAVVAGVLVRAGSWFGLHQPSPAALTGGLLTVAVLVGLGAFDRLIGRRLARGEHGG